MNWPSDFTFFADEDLGTLIFPEILRDAGVTLETLAEMAQIFVGLREQITNFLRQNPAPFIARLYRDRIEMWLSHDDWTP